MTVWSKSILLKLREEFCCSKTPIMMNLCFLRVKVLPMGRELLNRLRARVLPMMAGLRLPVDFELLIKEPEFRGKSVILARSEEVPRTEAELTVCLAFKL